MDIGLVYQAKKLPSAELNLGGTSTSAVQFKDSGGSDGLICYIPGSNKLKNRRFKVRASGRVTGGTTTNFTITMYYGVSATVSSNTAIEASTARAVDSASHNWMIEADLVWDVTSQKLQGMGISVVANIGVDAWAVINNVPTSVDLSGEGLGFTLTGTFSTGNASNVAYCDQFELIPQ